MIRKYALASLAVAGLTLTACSGNAAPTSTGSTKPATPVRAQASAAAEPDTAAAAAAAATRYYALSSAGQWVAAYQLIDPEQQAKIPESLFIGFHESCVSPIAGETVTISNPVMADSTHVVVTASLSGIGSALGSAQDTMVYSGGHWYGHIDDSTMAIYAGGTVASAIAAAKAKNLCAAS